MYYGKYQLIIIIMMPSNCYKIHLFCRCVGGFSH